MALGPKYQFRREGRWHLWVVPELWDRRLWAEILHHFADGPALGRAETRLLRPQGEGGSELYLKLYPRPRLWAAFKDLFRDSRAVRALKQGELLIERGFHAPPAVAAGEQRSCGILKGAFLLTSAVQGLSLPSLLRERSSPPLDSETLRTKREWLKQLALEIRRLHQEGLVHGDLVPSNILAQAEKQRVTFFYIDNDRTRRYPVWLPQGLWKRNLIQLNRFVLPGISLQDRMRFLRYYLGERPWGERERRLALLLERRTRKRRRECDRIEAQVSFRELMRWNGPFARHLR